VLGGLALVSLVAPADLAAPARMSVYPTHLALDYWFLLPVVLADRLSSGATWGLGLTAGLALVSVPWALAAGRARTALVVPARCTSCNKCYEDCPYDAIDMVARSDGRAYAQVAEVSLDKCVGCGICAGSCDSAGVGIPWFDALSQRHRIDALVESSTERAAGRGLLFLCAESAGQDLAVDASGRAAELPGYHVVRVPCAGWVHPLLAERARRRGASHVLIASCGEGSCRFREGGKWTRARMTGAREPALRLDRVGSDRVRTIALFRHESAKLLGAASELSNLTENARSGSAEGSGAGSGIGRRIAASAFGCALLGLLAVAIWWPSRASHHAPERASGALVVSFKHAGSSASVCRELRAEERAKLPLHMRPQQVCERSRVDVRLRVSLDGREIVRRSYPPQGVWGDGNSIAVEEFLVPGGAHTVLVELGDSPRPGEYPHRSEKRVAFRRDHKNVVVFDKLGGFRWYD
jgi:coenzyme F420-reducing hydrogenase delta subunit/ferredoxin